MCDATVMERLLAAVLTLSKLAAFFITMDRLSGFDVDAHTIVTESILAAPFDLPLRTMFYAYHPPFAFLMARAIQQFGLSTIISMKLVSLTSMLAAFLWMRETLRRLSLLHEPHGMAFLYICFGLPIAAFMSHSANLEAPLFAAMTLVIWACVGAFTPRPQAKPNRTTCYAILAITGLTIGLLTKFSGIALLIIPLLSAIALRRAPSRHSLSLAMIMILGSVAIVSPYYYHRYYVRTGAIFPSNTEWLRPTALSSSREKRDADPLRFFVDLLSPTPTHTSRGYTRRDWGTVHLADAWRDLWLKDAYLGRVPTRMQGIGVTYIWTGALLALFGAVALRSWKYTPAAWQQLGFIILGLATLTLGLFIAYLYSQPLARWGPGKGLYAACTIPGVAYLIVMPLAMPKVRAYAQLLRQALVVFLMIFIVLNHCFMKY